MAGRIFGRAARPRDFLAAASRTAVIAAFATAACSPALAIEISATWNGGTGLWSADNWTFGSAVGADDPDNDGANQFNVSIDGSPAVSSEVTLDKNVTIDSLAVDENDSLVVSPGFGLTITQSDSRPSSGSIANNGTIMLQSSDTDAASLLIDGAVTLGGGGRLVLDGPADVAVFPPDQDPDMLRARSFVRSTGSGGTLTNENHTIAGSGQFGFSDIGLVNGAGGVIDANVADAALVIAGRDQTTALPGMTNLGTMQASDGGILRLFFGTYDQVDGAEAGTIQALDGSTVHIENSAVTILGGALNTAAGGQMLVRSSLLALDGTDIGNQGSLLSDSTLTMTGGDLDNGGVMSFDEDAFLVLKGTSVTNGGTIELTSRAQAVSGNDAFGGGLLIDGAVTLGGGGRLVLGGPADAVVFAPDQDPDSLRARSFIGHTGLSGTLTNENHTIEGSGHIGLLDLGLVNGVGGVIDANVADAALVVAGQDQTTALPGMTNLGIMQASDGGILRLFQGTYDQVEGLDAGTIQALDGSTVHIENSAVTILGGALNAVAGGQLLVRSSFVTLDGTAVDNQGSFQVDQAFVRLQGNDFANGGTVTIADGGLLDVDGAYVQSSGGTVLDGGILEADAIDIDQGTLSGNGTVRGAATLNGTLAAGFSSGILNFEDDSIFNGIIQVELGGTLVDGAGPSQSLVNVGTDPSTTAYDQYNVFGAATFLDGLRFDVSLIDAFDPLVGDFFDIFTAERLIADLTLLDFLFPTLSGNHTFAANLVSFGGWDALRLTVVSSAVPEPGTVWLFVVGLLGAGWIVVRRRTPALTLTPWPRLPTFVGSRTAPPCSNCV